eukprot:TRINITY_DN7400_c0_g1_i3.p7 TRINITY_DN7400_c0_g1~~TRINITY_DN7400_c0_g1_i3.p7  ORF type:complete len:100 (-),score=5.97 TRINITY_DN7400_c0_g1_i3:1530-1829(-)
MGPKAPISGIVLPEQGPQSTVQLVQLSPTASQIELPHVLVKFGRVIPPSNPPVLLLSVAVTTETSQVLDSPRASVAVHMVVVSFRLKAWLNGGLQDTST